MTDPFVSSRLQMARSLRGFTAAALAREAGTTPEWLSKVERNRTTPSDELIGRLAKVLDLPTDFFYRDTAFLPSNDAFHFRASSKLARKDELAARSLASLATELSAWMNRSYELPRAGIPEIQELAGADVDAGPEVAAGAQIGRAHV